MFSVQQRAFVVPSATEGLPLCILLVDDDGGLLRMLVEVLEGFGHRVITASSGMKAMELYARHQDEIDVVLMDYHMPGMDGGRVYESMREVKPAAKIIFMSSVDSLQLRQIFARRPISGYLCKPLQIAELEYVIRKVVPKNRPAQT